MKNYFALTLLISVTMWIGVSCKKKDTKANNDASSSKPTSPTEVDSTSAFYITLNGTTTPVHDTVYRTPATNTYAWSGGSSNSGCSIYIQFSGTNTTLATYSVVNDSLQNSGDRCFFDVSWNYGGGHATAGAVTISAGNPKKVSFTHILVPGTQSNAAVTFTVSGVFPLY